MEKTKKRVLELAEVIASTEPPYTKAIHEAKQELNEHLKKVDSQTQKEVMERIRGFD